MENLKKAIFIVVGFIVLIIIILIVLFVLKNKTPRNPEIRKEEESYVDMLNNPASIVNGKKPEEVTMENIYFNTENCIREYITKIAQKDTKAICALLENTYQKEQNITEENVLSKIGEIADITSYQTEEMYNLAGVNFHVFYVKSAIGQKEYYYIVNCDYKNETFNIIPIKKENYSAKIKEVVKGKTGAEETIQKNEYNKIKVSKLTEAEVVRAYLKDYINKAKNNPEKAYEVLQEEYRNKKFGTIEEYQKYIMYNKEKLEDTIIKKYGISSNNGKKIYTCLDNYGNQYEFETTAAMKYTVKLDNYTVPTEEYKQTYQSLKEEEKVKTNLEIWIKMINEKSYKQVYSCLYEDFRVKYFKTQKELEEYLTSQFYSYNILGIKEINKESNHYVCKINVKESLSSAAETKELTIIMELQENGTDFSISFER